jgi:hypothetical protein
MYNGKKSKSFRATECLIEQPSAGVIDTFPDEILHYLGPCSAAGLPALGNITACS